MGKSELQKQVENMRAYGMTEEEIQDVLAYDKKIDKSKESEQMEHDLPVEQAKMAKKFANTNERKKPIIFDNKPRERKPNDTKRTLISALYEFLQKQNGCADVTIEKAEKLLTFTCDGHSYKLDLIQTRNK